MRLLTLTNLYPPQHLGGFGLCMERLVRGLGGMGYETHVLTSDQPYLGRDRSDPRVIRSLELLGSYQNGVSRLNDAEEEERRRANNGEKLEQMLEAVQPQACLVGNLDLLGTALLHQVCARGIATIQHVGFMAAPYPPQDFPGTPNYRMAFASREVQRLLLAQGWPVTEHPVVHPPLDPCIGLNSPIRAVEPSGPLRIGYSGLVMHSKGVHTLLEACVLLRQWGIPFHLELAGKAFSPDYQHQLQRYAQEQGISLHLNWLGFLEGQAIPEFYNRLDVLVFPSMHPESFGMVVAEAMAQGVVPISTGVGGAFEVITHGVDGLLCDPGESHSVASALYWCHRNRDALAAMGRRAQRHARQRFSTSQSAKVLDLHYQQMLGNGASFRAPKVMSF